MYAGNQPIPEVGGLGVWVIYAESAHSGFDPNHERFIDFVIDGILRVIEVEWIDILILLRWVLSVGDGAIWKDSEKFWVAGGPRVIGRCLQREIERYL